MQIKDCPEQNLRTSLCLKLIAIVWKILTFSPSRFWIECTSYWNSYFRSCVNFSRKISSELKTRELIIKIFQEHPGWTYKKIARQAKVCRETVSSVIKDSMRTWQSTGKKVLKENKVSGVQKGWGKSSPCLRRILISQQEKWPKKQVARRHLLKE